MSATRSAAVSSLEDPNDPNVLARGHRLRAAYAQFMRDGPPTFLRGAAAQVYVAQNQPLTAGVPMASEFVPQASQDLATVKYLQDYLISQGLTPP